MSKTIIITGAGSGIGAATARIFLDEGFQVGLLGRQAKTLENTARGNKNALVLPHMMSQILTTLRGFLRMQKKWGRLDVLFNNAGIGSFSNTIDKIPVQTWLDVVAVNLTGSFLCARAAI